MSRKGDCWDNAPMESFFGSLKNELVHRTTFPTREAARRAIFEYVEAFYNRRRRHSGLGFLTPAQAHEQDGRGRVMHLNRVSSRPSQAHPAKCAVLHVSAVVR